MSGKSPSPSAPNPGWFPKGRSGNLNGRPRASRAPKSSAFEVLMEKTVTVADRGGTREITVEEALQQRTYRDALEGKRPAMREVHGMDQEARGLAGRAYAESVSARFRTSHLW